MPTFNITAPNGRKFRVTGDTPEGALAAVQQMAAAPAAPPVTTAAGPIQTAAQGDTTDLMGSLGAAGRGALDTATFGTSDEAIAGLKTGFGFFGDYGKSVANERDLLKQAQEQHPIAFGAGQVAGVLPTLAIPGMGIAKGATLAGKVGRGILAGGAQGVAYGAGSAEGGVPERAQGALTGGLIGAGTGAAVPIVGNVIGKAIGGAAGRAAVPTSDAIKATSSAGFKQAEAIGATVAPNSFAKMANDLVTTLNREGIDKDIQNQSFAAAQKIVNAAKTGAPATLQDMSIFRQVASNIARDGMAGANEQRIAGKIVGHLDDFMENLKPSDVISGDPARAVPLVKEARRLWKIQAKGQIIEDTIKWAAEQQAGLESGLRNGFKALLKPGRYKWTPDETVAIQKISRGTTTNNILRFLGTFGVPIDQGRNWLGATSGVVGGNALGGPAVAAALTIGGTAAKAGSRAVTKANAERALKTVLNAGARPFDQAAFTKAGQRSARFLDPFARGAVVPAYAGARR